MKKLLLLFLFFAYSMQVHSQTDSKVALVVHGGAGTISREYMTPELEAQYHAKLAEALDAGYAILNKGGSSLDAVVAAVKVLEDSPLFNAGKGAVFTNEGKNEMDASIMDGRDRNCGSVAGITIVKNPIEAARAVMEKSEHVMMAGKGAEEFAKMQGLTLVDPSYFYTEERMRQLKEVQEEERKGGSGWYGNWEGPGSHKFGTVGAVALDKAGNLAAATSTGGMTNKRFGRIGDSPIIGAGTYADNATCAVSCTGHGEYFIRVGVARDIAALVGYKKMSVKAAAKKVVQEHLGNMGGTGGIIALDRKGNFTMEFNTPGMYRGYITADGVKKTLIFK